MPYFSSLMYPSSTICLQNNSSVPPHLPEYLLFQRKSGFFNYIECCKRCSNCNCALRKCGGSEDVAGDIQDNNAKTGAGRKGCNYSMGAGGVNHRAGLEKSFLVCILKQLLCPSFWQSVKESHKLFSGALQVKLRTRTKPRPGHSRSCQGTATSPGQALRAHSGAGRAQQWGNF